MPRMRSPTPSPIISAPAIFPASAILCERESTNTGDNVTKALPLIDAAYGLRNIASLIAVGKIRRRGAI